MKAEARNKTEALKNFIRAPFVFPGGYPLQMVMADGESVCHKCAKENFALILRATRENDRSEWAVMVIGINWESTDIYCAHCNAAIESAYGGE